MSNHLQTVFFDYDATTPLDPRVREVMLRHLDDAWGNPSSVHHVGQHARALLDEARERTAAVLQCKPSEVVFTSGGTESANLAIFGTARALKAKGRHLIASPVEHHAVLHSLEYLAKHEGFEVTWLSVDSEGRVDPADLKKALRLDTVLVSVMAANNEIGTLQPVAERVWIFGDGRSGWLRRVGEIRYWIFDIREWRRAEFQLPHYSRFLLPCEPHRQPTSALYRQLPAHHRHLHADICPFR